ncbi:MAG: PIN domain-containing protein [Candidatus Micrarchaeota archaeon]
MKKVVLDTNFLLAPYQFKIDIFTQLRDMIPTNYELYVSKRILHEITRLSQSTGRHASAARFALKLIAVNKVKVIDSDEFADDWIVKYAEEDEDVIVCTNDIFLKNRVKARKRKVVGMRTKARLAFL